MKILFISPYFPPEVGAAQTRVFELATRLQKLGHEVSVLTTFPNYPTGIVPSEWRGRFLWNGQEGTLPTCRIWSYATANRGFLRRIISHLSFAFFASLRSLLGSRQDIVIIESPPLFDGLIGLLLSAFRRIPYVFTVSDLWPESAIQMGMLKNRLLIKASKALELMVYRRATGVLALTTGIQQAILRDGIKYEKVVLFRNSVDCDFFRPFEKDGDLRAEIGVPDSAFVALYAGTFGLAHSLATVLDASAALQSKETGGRPVHFVLAGAGAESDSLKQKAKRLQLRNVTILDPLPKARMPELINAADCVLVPLRKLDIFLGALPTKMFEAMACGRPVVLAIAGEAEQLMRESGAGYVIEPENPSALVEAIHSLISDPSMTSELGRNGRNYVVKHFNRDARALELSEALGRLLSKQPGSDAALERAA